MPILFPKLVSMTVLTFEISCLNSYQSNLDLQWRRWERVFHYINTHRSACAADLLTNSFQVMLCKIRVNFLLHFRNLIDVLYGDAASAFMAW